MWMRKFRLEISGDIEKVFTEHRIDFRYNEYFALGDLTNMADTFDVDIFNLSTENFNYLKSGDEVNVKFYTGYEDEGTLDLAFEGIVTNVTGRRSIPEHITTLWCIPKGLANTNKSISYKGTREDTLGSVLTNIADSLSLRIKFEGVEDILDEPYRAKTIEGIGIEELVTIGKQFKFMPRVQDSNLRIIATPEEGSINKLKTVRQLQANLMRGVPKASVSKLSIPYAFNTTISTGDVIDATILLGDVNTNTPNSTGIGVPNGITNVAGLGKGSLHYSDTLYKWAIRDKYQIVSAVHYGSNYTKDFISNYECVAYIDSKKGN